MLLGRLLVAVATTAAPTASNHRRAHPLRPIRKPQKFKLAPEFKLLPPPLHGHCSRAPEGCRGGWLRARACSEAGHAIRGCSLSVTVPSVCLDSSATFEEALAQAQAPAQAPAAGRRPEGAGHGDDDDEFGSHKRAFRFENHHFCFSASATCRASARRRSGSPPAGPIRPIENASGAGRRGPKQKLQIKY